MKIAVAGICDIFVPPNAFGIDSVMRKCVAFDYRPTGKRTRFETAVLYFILRRRVRIRNVIAHFREEFALLLGVSVFAYSDIVHGEITVIIAFVVIDYADIYPFARISG